MGGGDGGRVEGSGRHEEGWGDGGRVREDGGEGEA